MSQGAPRWCRAYVAAIVALGAVPLGFALRVVIEQPMPIGWLVLAALSLLSGPLAIRIPSISATISVSEGFIFAAGLLFGPAAATITAVLDGLAVSLWNRHRSVRRLLFNVAEPAFSVTVATSVFYWISGATPLLYQRVAFWPLLPSLLAMTTLYFALNTALLAIAVWLDSGTSPVEVVRRHASHLALDFCVTLSLAAVIVQTSANVTVAAIAVLVPMLLASYLSSHYVAGRLEESSRHLAELQRLYDSTVETLAMAIDAKDQITHGHIRRVQLLSSRLAQAVGASEQEARALEAAALLHDLGKLAIPEHILNKPGALTPAEYDQMRAHAAIGAGILSRIEFPFPVVPIVRHHHESWDGTGYPDGLCREAIPLGARILAVVDCYDALTSDRPYRRRMSPDDAVEIIRRRSGQMYDPAIVDAFLVVHAGLPAEREPAETGPALVPFPFTPSPAYPPPVVPVSTSTLRRRRQSVYDFAVRVRGVSMRQLGAAVTGFFADAQPDAAAALYRFDVPSDALVLVDAAESVLAVVPDRVRLGTGVTGWVGSTRSIMTNADAALDLGEAAGIAPLPLRMCMSVPIVCEHELAGVLTVYAPCAFNEGDRLIVEVMAEELAPLFAGAAGSDNDSLAPPVASGQWPVAASR